MKANLTHVAKLAGVSMATVDRVLNERGGVSPATAERVARAAEAVGIRRLIPQAYRRKYSVEIIVEKSSSLFSQVIHNTLQNFVKDVAASMIVRRQVFESRRRDAIPDYIRNVRSDAIILACRETADVVDAVNAVTAKGVPVVTIISDLLASSRVKHFGTDNLSAGRAAAYFFSLMLREKHVKLLVRGDLSERTEAERAAGFEQGFMEYYAGHFDVDVATCSHDLQTGRSVREAFRQDSYITGLYVTNSEIRETVSFLSRTGRVIPIIAHELTPFSQEQLARRLVSLVIDQNVYLQFEAALGEVARHFGLSSGPHVPSSIPFTIHSPDNLNCIAQR